MDESFSKATIMFAEANTTKAARSIQPQRTEILPRRTEFGIVPAQKP